MKRKRTAVRLSLQPVEKFLRAQRASNRKLRLAAISIKTRDMRVGFYTNRWQVCPQGARRQRNFRSKAWFRSRGCSKNYVFRQPQRTAVRLSLFFQSARRFAGHFRQYCQSASGADGSALPAFVIYFRIRLFARVWLMPRCFAMRREEPYF